MPGSKEAGWEVWICGNLRCNQMNWGGYPASCFNCHNPRAAPDMNRNPTALPVPVSSKELSNALKKVTQDADEEKKANKERIAALRKELHEQKEDLSRMRSDYDSTKREQSLFNRGVTSNLLGLDTRQDVHELRAESDRERIRATEESIKEMSQALKQLLDAQKENTGSNGSRDAFTLPADETKDAEEASTSIGSRGAFTLPTDETKDAEEASTSSGSRGAFTLPTDSTQDAEEASTSSGSRDAGTRALVLETAQASSGIGSRGAGTRALSTRAPPPL